MKALAPHELEKFKGLTKRQQSCYRRLVQLREADEEFAETLREIVALHGGLFSFVKTQRSLSEMLAKDALGDLPGEDLQASLNPDAD